MKQVKYQAIWFNGHYLDSPLVINIDADSRDEAETVAELYLKKEYNHYFEDMDNEEFLEATSDMFVVEVEQIDIINLKEVSNDTK